MENSLYIQTASPPHQKKQAVTINNNGGGFFNANSAHPFENPTPFTNLFEMLAIFSISAGLTYTLGRMTGSQRHGWAVFAADDSRQLFAPRR